MGSSLSILNKKRLKTYKKHLNTERIVEMKKSNKKLIKKTLTTEVINELIGVDDSWKAPQALLEKLFKKEDREELFCQFLEVDSNLGFDWFHMYFQDESADRAKLKQDFTPQSIADIVNKIVVGDETTESDNYLEVAAGTGGLVITHWDSHRKKQAPYNYKPSEHFHHVEEISDRAMPFLLFNLMIRGMNAVVVHGDTLNRDSKGVFFIQNETDDSLGFSSLNVLPYSTEIEKEFNVKFDVRFYPEHVESKGIPAHVVDKLK